MKRRAGLALALAMGVFLAASCAARLEGVLAMTGSAPFATLVLVLDDGRSVAVRGPLLDELRGLQYKRVVLEGELAEGAGAPGAPPAFEVSAIVSVLD